MVKFNCIGYIPGSLCKSVRRNKPSVSMSRNNEPDYAGLFDFVMLYYADEVARMRAGVRERSNVV